MSDLDGFICAGPVDALQAGGPALVFEIDAENFENGFAIIYQGRVRCYRNSCPHLGSELDWNRGDFFSADGSHLVCSTHGALFKPESGECVSGPCRGQRLSALMHRIVDGMIHVRC